MMLAGSLAAPRAGVPSARRCCSAFKGAQVSKRAPLRVVRRQRADVRVRASYDYGVEEEEDQEQQYVPEWPNPQFVEEVRCSWIGTAALGPAMMERGPLLLPRAGSSNGGDPQLLDWACKTPLPRPYPPPHRSHTPHARTRQTLAAFPEKMIANVEEARTLWENG